MGKIKAFRQFIGPRASRWLVLASLAGLALAGTEMVFSVLLQMIFVKLGITADSPRLPGGYAFPAWTLSTVLSVFVGVGVLRSLLHFTILHGSSASKELVNERLKLLALDELLREDRGFLSTSKIQNYLG